jgi:hypothetical protein
VETPPHFSKDHDMTLTARSVRPVARISDPSMIARIARQMAEAHPGTVVVIGDHKEAAR